MSHFISLYQSASRNSQAPDMIFIMMSFIMSCSLRCLLAVPRHKFDKIFHSRYGCQYRSWWQALFSSTFQRYDEPIRLNICLSILNGREFLLLAFTFSLTISFLPLAICPEQASLIKTRFLFHTLDRNNNTKFDAFISSLILALLAERYLIFARILW